MRRPVGSASASRLCAASLAIGMVMTVPNLAPNLALAQPAQADGMARLVTDVADINQQLQDLGAQIQMQQESVNKAILDVQTARDDAAAAQLEVDASAQRVKDANAAIAAAQDRFDTFAASMYVSGPSSSYLTATDPTDILNTAATGSRPTGGAPPRRRQCACGHLPHPDHSLAACPRASLFRAP